jgi:uncharacterized membrane protein
LAGFIDATYLAVEHFKGQIPPCSLVSGCESVLSSSYSEFYGIPVSLFGSVFYFLILLGTSLYFFEGKKEIFLRFPLLLTPFGFLASLWFVYLQAFVIKSFCQYCLVSAFTSTALFVMAFLVFIRYSGEDKNEAFKHTDN